VAEYAGSPFAFLACISFVVLWAISGPLFGFSDTWQLVINTSTTIITFLMVFLIQNTQNRDNGALQAKLDELIRATVEADNESIGIEHLTDHELKAILEKVEKNAYRLHNERQRRGEGSPDKKPAKTSPRQSTGAARKKPAAKAKG
jgi:low affinity Fe/Cu permease